MSGSEYWDRRGELRVKYRGEWFYTITPLPYYFQRRALVLKLLKQALERKNIQRICDYGCGDGYYAEHLKGCFPEIEIDGYDISPVLLGTDKRENQDFAYILRLYHFLGQNKQTLPLLLELQLKNYPDYRLDKSSFQDFVL